LVEKPWHHTVPKPKETRHDTAYLLWIEELETRATPSVSPIADFAFLPRELI
jgi:hypothetical protein